MENNKFFDKKTVASGVAVNVFKKALKSNYVRKKYLCSHRVQKLGNDTYMITEAMLFNSYLFVGKERALLIDTGIGISGLLEAVKKITDKPLAVVATHSHFSSVGGAGAFDKVYIHKSDLKDAVKYNKYRYRKFLYNILPTKLLLSLDDDALIEDKGKFVPLKKDHEFDLGGRRIRVIHTPSHTQGSCCFVDSETDITITGHVTTPISLMIFPHSTTISVYADSFDKLIEFIRERRNYAGFGLKPLLYSRTCDLKDLTDEATAFGNDYTRFIRIRMSSDKRRMLVYFPAKTIKRNIFKRILSLQI